MQHCWTANVACGEVCIGEPQKSHLRLCLTYFQYFMT